MLGSILSYATSALGPGASETEKVDPTSPLSAATSSMSLGPPTPTPMEKRSAGLLPNWQSPYTGNPPALPKKGRKYKEEEALEDLPAMCYALQLFLESHMMECEEFLQKGDTKKERLYYTVGYGLIQCVKALMSYEDEDLLAAIGHAKHAHLIADQHRKKQAFLGSRMAGYVVSAIHSNPVAFIKSMTDVERHAELVYAETMFEKALLGIVYSGDWLAFIKEALNMRTTITIYRQLGQFLEAVDAEATERGEGPIDTSVDPHFRSGVYLGVGVSHLVLSMMPGKLQTLVELFGYRGDRKFGLEMLGKAGGWEGQGQEPLVSAANEGVRRTICDMTLLIFHLVISSFTFEGVSIPLAERILAWNLKRYPNGVFFLFGAGRLAITQSQPAKAIEYYEAAMKSQMQYKNLHHISYWEMALAWWSLWDVEKSRECWEVLEKEATWSKAIYTYGLAVCSLEVERSEKGKKEAGALLGKVPGLRQRIAGKSIPLEKFVARKARKFTSQNNHLALPVLELAYIFLGIQHAPRRIILTKMLPEVNQLLATLASFAGGKEDAYNGGHGGYHDDLALGKFLEGVCWRFVAFPDAEAVPEEGESPLGADEKRDAEEQAERALRAVLEGGPKIEFDHHLVYHTHYELGRLFVCQGKFEEAKHEFELVLSGKYLEVGSSGRKGRYSLENTLHVRCHAALDALQSKAA